ncbi:polysaccharide biosynthesis/export family protein [Coraliomargarita akajimensis]|uniref:Polysaccharide export protein n=1 Tax=Coraliomargarita akajimensis (strain DSM 45221 / IAM 15411 / JCM 23193 / KCTC 12865 / 04OKA010-24) TaxID=583355 RepID=D5ENH6_CORAD|nr:polysaccharide biosynthesis/export family protein [Coraliomargarita akajimensis]ADE55452.1 polysaccharide export protein [Coraliomargarita akajimensis DSM 45221]
MKRILNSLLLLLVASLSVISSVSAQDAGAGVPAPSLPSSGGGGSGFGLAVSENYVLKPSDVVSIEVYQEQDLNKQVRVEGDGTISLALIGKVKVANMTVAEAQTLITELYNRDYLVDPQISLLVVDFSPQYVRVLGHVGAPGYVPIPPDKELTLIDAITQCRGVTRLGDDKNVTITRLREDGSSRPIKVNFKNIKRGEAKDYILKEGDTIYVPERII